MNFFMPSLDFPLDAGSANLGKDVKASKSPIGPRD